MATPSSLVVIQGVSSLRWTRGLPTVALVCHGRRRGPSWKWSMACRDSWTVSLWGRRGRVSGCCRAHELKIYISTLPTCSWLVVLEHLTAHS